MRKSILTLGIAAVLTGVLATCSMAYAADDELAQIQESGKLIGVWRIGSFHTDFQFS